MKISDFLKIKYLSESLGLVAAWLFPNGKILDCGALSHIIFVLKYPQKFGLTDEDIKDCTRYQDADETGNKGVTVYTDGIEDKAWDRVIKTLLERGFIRIRKVRSNKYSYTWYIDVYEYNRMSRKRLSDWAYNMGDKEKDSRVLISVMRGDVPARNLTMSSLTGLSEEHNLLELIVLEED
jgi:hypothetical protein